MLSVDTSRCREKINEGKWIDACSTCKCTETLIDLFLRAISVTPIDKLQIQLAVRSYPKWYHIWPEFAVLAKRHNLVLNCHLKKNMLLIWRTLSYAVLSCLIVVHIMLFPQNSSLDLCAFEILFALLKPMPPFFFCITPCRVCLDTWNMLMHLSNSLNHINYINFSWRYPPIRH